MATVQKLLNRAGRMLGIVEPNTDLDANQTADFLTGLNAMLESWQNDKLFIYGVRSDAKAMVVGQVAYTIGTGGDFNIPRPTFVESLNVQAGGIDYPPMKLLTPAQYAAIAQKTVATSDIPDHYKYEIGPTLDTVTIWPSPSKTSTLYLLSYRVIAAFSAASDTVTLPSGYEDALTTNLAVAMLPEYPQGGAGIQIVMQRAKETKAAIKRTNTKPIKAHTPYLNAISRAGHSDIYAGE